MSRTTLCLVACASLAGTFGCTDRPATTAPPPERPATAAPSPPSHAATAEQLARRLAKALHSAAFRAYVKAQLDGSPFREHKLHLQRFLAANGKRALQEIADQNGIAAADVERDAEAAIPLKLYLPVPAHRAAWTGDENLLVATAIADHEAPVAFDPKGTRQLLSPDQPPATPVLALVPVETDFNAPPARVLCLDNCGGGGGGGSPPPPSPGLYMTQSHFRQDFEGWLKGSPEFEVHILGQKGQTDSLTDYQCAGDHKSAPYYFDQNNLDWSGSVLLFSKPQLDGYNTAHPGKNVRVFVVEDDDGPCEIKNDPNRLRQLLAKVDSVFRALTSGNDSSRVVKAWKYAKAAQNIFSVIASLIKTNDELVGNAIEDVIALEFHQGFNWIVKGENNVTNGWIKLEMR